MSILIKEIAFSTKKRIIFNFKIVLYDSQYKLWYGHIMKH